MGTGKFNMLDLPSNRAFDKAGIEGKTAQKNFKLWMKKSTMRVREERKKTLMPETTDSSVSLILIQGHYVFHIACFLGWFMVKKPTVSQFRFTCGPFFSK